jgi:hypothetical protein
MDHRTELARRSFLGRRTVEQRKCDRTERLVGWGSKLKRELPHGARPDQDETGRL